MSTRRCFPTKTRLSPTFTAPPSNLTSTSRKMSETPVPIHEPPSLPSSPLPKRTKVIDPTPLSHTSTLPRGTDSGAATPTPLAATHLPSHDNMAALQPPASIAASSSAAAEQQLQVQLLSPNAKAPTKGSAFAAGHDLYSAEDTMIPARGRALVKTDIKISVPDGTCTYPSSGLAQSSYSFINWMHETDEFRI
jgi:dUTP pyrophosphatase